MSERAKEEQDIAWREKEREREEGSKREICRKIVKRENRHNEKGQEVKRQRAKRGREWREKKGRGTEQLEKETKN